MPESPEDPAIISSLPPLTPSTSRSTRDLAIETAVVLGICTLPNLFKSIVSPYFFPARHSPAGPFLYESLSNLVYDLGRIALVAYLIFRSGEPLSRFGIRRFRRLADPFTGVGIYILHVIWYFILWTAIGFLQKHRLIEISRRYHELFDTPSGFVEYAILLFMCLAVGLAEELIYRAYLIPRFEQLLDSTGLAILFTSVIFGGVHIYQGEHGFISATTMAFLYGSLFCLFRRLWPIAISHAIWDFMIYAKLH